MNDYLLAYVAIMQIRKNMKDEMAPQTKEPKIKKHRR